MTHNVRELVHIDGLKEFKQKLTEFVSELEEESVQEALVEIGEFLRDAARGNLPDTWRVLPDSLGVDVDAANFGLKVGPRYGFSTEMGDPVEFGIYHEFGISSYKKTPKPGGGHYYQGPTPARHYLERAIEENEAEIVQIVAKMVNSVIEKGKK